MVTDEQAYCRMVSGLDQAVAEAEPEKRAVIKAFRDRYLQRAVKLADSKRKHKITNGHTWTHWWGSWDDRL